MTNPPEPDDVVGRLAAIEARLEKATPGPWHVDKHSAYIWSARDEMVADSDCIGRLPERAVVRIRGVGASLPIEDNMQFIAHAREDIPWLVAECTRLRSELSSAEGEIATCKKALEPFAFYSLNSKGLLDAYVITTGSSMAIRQLTIGDCRRARERLEAE